MEEKNKEEEKNFLEKYKTDKKFKAKVQLIGYGIIIIIVILYANISSMSAPKTGNRILNLPDTKTTEQESKKENLLTKITNNYEYEIKVTYQDNKQINYTGKKAKNNTEITKKENETTTNYYKVDTRYYTKTNDNYELIKEDEIYNPIGKEFIELDSIKEYIDKSSLDHVTDYSSGKKEYVYHLKVKDIIKSYLELDKIEINITEENEILTIEINYNKLLEATKNEIKECKIEYIYKNINSIEDFTIIEEGNNNE